MQTLGLVLWLTVPTTNLPPSAASRPEPLFKAAGGTFFALSVADLRASTKWYSEKLGLGVVMEVPKKDGATVTVLEGGGLIGELIQLDAAVPLRRAAPRATGAQSVHGIFKVGLVVEEFDQTVAALRARGIE